jgi:hypothetical protein
MPGAASFMAALRPKYRHKTAVQVPMKTVMIREISVCRQFSTRISIAGAKPAPKSDTDESARLTTVL